MERELIERDVIILEDDSMITINNIPMSRIFMINLMLSDNIVANFFGGKSKVSFTEYAWYDKEVSLRLESIIRNRAYYPGIDV